MARGRLGYGDEAEESWGSEGGGGFDDSDLVELEMRLRDEVDSDLFQDPKHFKTLDRVIDVLGSEMIDLHSDFERLSQSNPAYRALRKQMEIVEDAIEHMAVARCAELNSSVVQVGRVSRQFTETMNKVRCLRRQVHDIRESLGAAQANPNEPTTPVSNGMVNGGGPVTPTGTSAGSAAMSLRELWLKKLECEAVLALLSKLEVIRLAPGEFDALVNSRTGGPCRIGAAVVLLSNALNIMFSDDVAQVQALHQILKEITSRQQRAEEIIWDTLHDVLYLRTGNGVKGAESSRATAGPSTNRSSAASVGHSVSSESKRRGRHLNRHGMSNPFFKATVGHAHDDDEDSVDTLGSGASLFSRDDSSVASSQKTNPNASGSKGQPGDAMRYPSMMGNLKSRMMIPFSVIDAELDLEADERRCLEESALSGVSNINASWDSVFAAHSRSNRPRYADHVLALRILVECLARLGKVDDIERMINDEMERELRRIAQREQARTFARLEKQRGMPRRKAAGDDLRDFRRHLTGLLSSFGCVMIRLSHLAQIVRHRIRSDPRLVRSTSNPSSALHSVLESAYTIIQKEIKGFLRACLTDPRPLGDGSSEAAAANSVSSHETGLFSLGILDTTKREGEGYSKIGSLTASRASTLELPAEGFVVKVLLPMTNTGPEARYALSFRRSLARWTDENEDLKKQLALVTGEDTSSPSYNTMTEESSLDFLDNFTKQFLLPVLQDDAVQGTVRALERDDAFDPVLDRNLYARSSSNEPQDVDMCIACQALYHSTAPLFLALHRLPAGGEMYLPVVAVLEHVMLTFISRVKQRVSQLSANKTALRFLLDTSAGGKEKAFGTVMERRRAYSQLLQAYADGSMLLSPVEESSSMLNKDPNLVPLSPPASDTKAKNGSGGDEAKVTSVVSEFDLAGGIEKEEQNLKFELAHLQSLLEFDKDFKMKNIIVCKDEELMKAATLAHSLLKLSSLFESRLKVKSSGSFEKPLTSTRALREAIKTIKAHGIKMAKFCRVDMILQTATRLSKICKSSTIVAKDAVRLPSCVNDLGEYLTGASDNLREAGGNAVTAYTFSALEQYIPLFLMQTVRVIARGQGIIAKNPLSLNGIEALDRSGSVLYRDLKGATSFDNSYWDDELAAVSFERSASFMAMMELEMDELEAYFRANQSDFSDKDFELMFEMNAPRRRGDIGRYNMMKRRIKS